MHVVDVEEFWDDLLAYVEDGRVLPVVGQELLQVQDVSLYRAVGERLLARYGIAGVDLREHQELNDAVCAIAARGKRVKDLYRPVHDILQKLVAAQTEPLPALRELASIAHFDLFATATPDDLLARALNHVRFGGAGQTDEIEYAPKLPTDRRRDMPQAPSSKYTAVFHLFGKADVAPFFAIHDEDALEFAYTLQAGNAPERIFSELRSRNVLLIGCNFGDWLNRFFLRLSNSERLFSDQRAKKEFLVGAATAADPGFVVFVERFSQDSRCYSIPARDFVAELVRRWSERNPGALARFGGSNGAPPPPAGGSTQGTIFISYSSDDIAAARRLFAGLEEIGGDVAWFDKSALKPGDDWEQHILSAIQRCAIFVPLLSASTQSRTEGYFRREWDEAAERSRRIQGRKFIFPVVIDAEFGGMGGYTLAPPQFQTYQYSHAPKGELTEALKAEISEQLRALRAKTRLS
jgi:hypothetical protein